ncbi:MAG: hypothetical protein AB7F65_02300 [Dehalococcoidia bacterium]
MSPVRRRPAPDRAATPGHDASDAGAVERSAEPSVQAAREGQPAALQGLQRTAGNRAVARLLRPRGQEAGSASADPSTAGAEHGSLQRTFTVKDGQGKPFQAFRDVAVETRLAFSDHLKSIEAADVMDFPGVWGNYLENKGVFDHYLAVFYNSGGNYGEFDLGQSGDVVRLYFLLKKWVMRDQAAKGSGPDEAPLHPDFTPGQIQFASISKGKVGSIYFPMGRLRLVHKGGPEVAITPGVIRYTISNQDYDDHWATLGSRTGVLQMQSCQPAAIGGGERLVEFWPGRRHPSRGAPQAFNYTLTQAQLNIIFRACLTGDNDTLKKAMARDQVLAQIPLAKV